MNTSTLLFFFPSLGHYLQGLIDIFFYPPEHFLKLMRSYCIKHRSNTLPLRGRNIIEKKTHITQQDPQFFSRKHDNLIIVLNTCLGYVKRHKLVRSHLKSRSIVLPLTKPIWSCIFDKIPTSPCLLRSFFPELECLVLCVLDRKKLFNKQVTLHKQFWGKG